MDNKLQVMYEKLKAIRTRTDLALKPSKYIKQKYMHFEEERDFSLRYYQIQGVLHLLAMRRFVLGDDTGTGKTIMSIGALCYSYEKTPLAKTLILTNKSAVEQWASEIEKFTEGIKVFICRGNPKQRAKTREAFFEYGEGPVVIIMGYRSLVQDFEFFQDVEGLIIIADEVAAVKNPETQVHQCLAHISQKATRVWGLTATLIKNNLMEGWGIYKIVAPGLFPGKGRFMEEYCITQLQSIPKSKRKIPVVVGYRKKDIVRFREKIDPYFLGRAKFDVAKELPSLITSEVFVNLTKKQQEKYDEALSGLLEVGEGSNAEVKETDKLTALIYCQQIVDHLGLIDVIGESAKTDTLLDLLLEGALAEEKVIVFTRFRKMVDLLMPILAKKKISAVRITGKEKEMERKVAMTSFQDPKSKTRVIVITMAASEAINLQSAKALIFYDSPWSGGDFLQILGRMIRIGSVYDKVFAMHLIARGTIDEHVLKTLRRKMDLINAVIGKRLKGEEDFVEVEVKNDISDLFYTLRRDADQRKEVLMMKG